MSLLIHIPFMPSICVFFHMSYIYICLMFYFIFYILYHIRFLTYYILHAIIFFISHYNLIKLYFMLYLLNWFFELIFMIENTKYNINQITLYLSISCFIVIFQVPIIQDDKKKGPILIKLIERNKKYLINLNQNIS